MGPGNAGGETVMRRLAVTIVVAMSVAALASLAPRSLVPSACAAAGSHHAALVVEHGDGSVVSRCVAFDASQVTGEELLTASGIAWSGQTFGGFGEAVCAMDGEPARYSSCPGSDGYWAVFVARGNGSWHLSNVGISTLTLADGDAEGFRFVPPSGNPVAPPLPVGVCAAAASLGPIATATATAAPMATAAAPAETAPTPAVTPAAVAAPTIGRTAPSADPAATDSASTASPPAADSPLMAVAGTTASAGPGASGGVAPGPAAARIPPAPGPDLGLLAAALAAGGLGGLALLRLIAPRRPSR
jgi:hypothetical protein